MLSSFLADNLPPDFSSAEFAHSAPNDARVSSFVRSEPRSSRGWPVASRARILNILQALETQRIASDFQASRAA